MGLAMAQGMVQAMQGCGRGSEGAVELGGTALKRMMQQRTRDRSPRLRAYVAHAIDPTALAALNATFVPDAKPRDHVNVSAL